MVVRTEGSPTRRRAFCRFPTRHGLPFSYTSDPLTFYLHKVDTWAAGGIKQNEPVTNPATKDFYLVRSLVEESITSSQLEGASTTREVAKQMIMESAGPETVANA